MPSSVRGHPAGYLKNNRSGEELKWKSKGYAVSQEERAAQQEQTHKAAARRVQAQARGLQPTDYLRAKGIQAHEGALTDAQGRTTFLPAADKGGKQWSMQYIDGEGGKRFARDSRKEGCFHAVGGLKALEQAPVIVMGEGYATMATLKEQLGLPATVAAFDAGNLLPVAKALREKFPDQPILVAGDDDRALATTLGTNPGREKAAAAARAVGGKAIFPIFAPGENGYPARLKPVTPQAFRAHEQARARLDQDHGELSVQEKQALLGELLQPAQLDAIATMKRHTDFNDLAQRSALGREALLRQVGLQVQQARQIQQADRKKQAQERKQAPRQGASQGVRQRHGMRAG